MKICTNHKKKIPLIWTFAFRGCEYWCPYCGDGGGMFGFGEEVVGNIRLYRLLNYYEQKTKIYLRAASMLGGARKRDKNGNYRTFKEYPENIKQKWRNIYNNYKKS